MKILKEEYKMKTHGQITKFEAGVIYRAWKEGNIDILPETASMMYDEAKLNPLFASERYSKDYRFYDQVENAVSYILNADYESSQNILKNIEQNMIKLAGKKSRYYKYK